MTILIADDHDTNRRLLRALLTAEGYEVCEAQDGGQALAVLKAASEPMVALIDWQMPVMAGIEVCRQVRTGANANRLFLILLTVRDNAEDIVAGLRTGANDYVTKPFNNDELMARVRIGVQMIELQESLSLRVRELEDALANVKKLERLLPICSYCKKIRDDRNYWQQVEGYITEHTGTQFSHGVCPHCWEKHVKPSLETLGMASQEIDGMAPPDSPGSRP